MLQFAKPHGINVEARDSAKGGFVYHGVYSFVATLGRTSYEANLL